MIFEKTVISILYYAVQQRLLIFNNFYINKTKKRVLHYICKPN